MSVPLFWPFGCSNQSSKVGTATLYFHREHDNGSYSRTASDRPGYSTADAFIAFRCLRCFDAAVVTGDAVIAEWFHQVAASKKNGHTPNMKAAVTRAQFTQHR